MTVVTYLIVALVVALVVWRATRVVRWWRAPAELPEPRKPFMTELEVQKLERKLGIGMPTALQDGTDRGDAIALATMMIASGNAQDVRAALEDFQVARVSHLEDDQLAAFVLRLQEYAEMDRDLENGPF